MANTVALRTTTVRKFHDNDSSVSDLDLAIGDRTHEVDLVFGMVPVVSVQSSDNHVDLTGSCSRI